MKSALASSLRAEDEAVRNRFEKAESLLESKTQQASSLPTEEPQQQSLDALQPAHKEKVIRDSFTLPSKDYELIAAIRQRCLGLAVNATKSEVIRAGLHILQSLSDEELVQAISSLEKVKTGRPSAKV
jgi:acetoin utilization deacetylase AcuC-like enzyme